MNDNVTPFPVKVSEQTYQLPDKIPENKQGGPGGPGDGGVEERLRAVELAVVEIKSDIKHLSTREDLLATRQDLSKEIGGVREEIGKLNIKMEEKFNAQTWKVFGAIIVAIGAIYYSNSSTISAIQANNQTLIKTIEKAYKEPSSMNKAE